LGEKKGIVALKISALLFVTLSFAGTGIVRAQTPAQPALPQRTVNLALPAQGSSACPSLKGGANCVRRVPAGSASSLQTAVNAATCGDTIVLNAGSTYSGNFTIPSTSCSGWIEIVSSALSSLPVSGNRVGPANTANMATISTPNVSPAIRFLPNSNHWRLMGIEITTSYVSTSGANMGLVSAGQESDGGTGISVQTQLPASLIFDRIYIHGLANTNTKRAIQMDTQGVAIVDSYCDEIHYNGNDSQCFVSWNGIGPYLIQNNFIQAAAENILFGGADPSVANLVPSDITVIGNVIQKNTVWREQAAPQNWVVKNILEFKNAQRVLIDSNVIQYLWMAGQTGYAILLTPRNQDGNCPWCTVNDVTVTHNLVRHVADGLEIASSDGNNTSLPSARVLVQNNVFDDVSSLNWGGHGWVYLFALGTGLASPHDITLDHNTSFPDFTNGAMLSLGDSGSAQNVRVSNLLSNSGAYGILGNGTAQGTPALNTFLSDFTVTTNALINSAGRPLGTYPSGTFWNTQAGAKFAGFSTANYQLQASSPYHNAGTDRKDIGVWDWACLTNRTAAALAGKFDPGSGCSAITSGTIEPPSDLHAVVVN
jgi:hypothetical protein